MRSSQPARRACAPARRPSGAAAAAADARCPRAAASSRRVQESGSGEARRHCAYPAHDPVPALATCCGPSRCRCRCRARCRHRCRWHCLCRARGRCHCRCRRHCRFRIPVPAPVAVAGRSAGRRLRDDGTEGLGEGAVSASVPGRPRSAWVPARERGRGSERASASVWAKVRALVLALASASAPASAWARPASDGGGAARGRRSASGRPRRGERRASGATQAAAARPPDARVPRPRSRVTRHHWERDGAPPLVLPLRRMSRRRRSLHARHCRDCGERDRSVGLLFRAEHAARQYEEPSRDNGGQRPRRCLRQR